MGLFGNNVRKNFKKKVDSYKSLDSIMGFFEQVGLPTVKQAMYGILVFEDKLMIVSENQEFSIRLDQLKFVDYKSERKTDREMRTSTAKAVVGTAMFGVAGAVIGSQAKQKTVKDVIMSSLVISFVNSKGEDAIIDFGYTTLPSDRMPVVMQEFASKLNQIINRMIPQNTGTIEL